LKHLLITGGTSGIGEAVVKAFLSADYKITLTYNSTLPEFNKISDRINCVKANLNNAGDVERLCDFVDNCPVDVFVNNAAMSIKTPFLNITRAELDAVMDVNIISMFRITQAVFAKMQASGGGKIINIGSIGGQTGGVDQIHYAISKGAQETLIKSLAKIGFERKVFAFNFSPGCVDTPMLRKLHEELSVVESAIPYGSVALPEDIGKVILALCSEEWNYASGQTINYNGGLLL